MQFVNALIINFSLHNGDEINVYWVSYLANSLTLQLPDLTKPGPKQSDTRGNRDPQGILAPAIPFSPTPSHRDTKEAAASRSVT